MNIAILSERDALSRELALEPAHCVIWVASSASEAISRCEKEAPELLLLDLSMEQTDGVDATRRIMARVPRAILLVTDSIDRHAARVYEAMDLGALDVVEVPSLAAGSPGQGALAVLAKVTTLSRILGGRYKPAPAGCRPTLVGIGASAGGPAAVAKLLDGLPRTFPAFVVIVQHVDEQFAAGMTAWLGQLSPLPVRVAREGVRLRAGTVLLAGSHDHLALTAADRLGYVAEPRQSSYRPSIDVFFQSVCRFWRGPAVGVLLTGMGRDGALGLKALRDRGHHTIAQDEATSAVYGMPKAAAAIDAAVEILPMERIQRRLMDLVYGKRLSSTAVHASVQPATGREGS